MKLYVQYENSVTDSYHSGEKYGEWWEEYNFYVSGVSVSQRRGCFESFEVPFELETGQPVYVLSMIYSSGDSFGNSTGNGEVIWVFKDKEIANDAKKALEGADDKYQIKFIAEGGNEITMSNPGWGYFENTTDISLECFMLDP